jgi:hypothetical protein
MPLPELPAELPEILSRTVALLQGGEDIGSRWNFGIDGLGFLLDTLDQEAPFEFRSYEVQSIPVQKPRIDDEAEPGEQTLAAWWARAQHSWHEGAGQKVFDSAFSSRFKFTESKGVSPWEKGELRLLKDVTEYRNDNFDDHHILGTPSAFLYTRNGNLVKDTDPETGGETVVSTHSGTLINSITSDGESLYAAYSGGSIGIRKIVISTFAATVLVNTHTDVDIIAFVKGRLLGGKNHQLFEYNLAVTTPPDPFYTDPATTWVWTGITESSNAVYFSGHAGERSEIFAARLTEQDIPFASVATLGALRSVWQAPEGEIIHTIKGYIGQQVLIGTSKGIRIASVVTGEGDLSVSALIAKTPQPVLALEPQLEYGWFGWTTFDGVSSGLGRVDLGTLAYASDLMFTSQGTVKEVTSFQNRLFFVVDEGTTSRIVKEHLTQLVAQGNMKNLDIRFSTTERKVVRFFDILVTGGGKWSLEVALDGGTFAIYTSENPVGGYHEEVLTLEGTKFGINIILHRHTDVTQGPVLQDWRLRSEPRATGKFRYLVPMMIYDTMITLDGGEVGGNGLATELLNHLEDIYRTGRDFGFIKLNSTEPIECVMEDLRFKAYTPPDQQFGFGGHALAVIREVR